MKKTIFDLSNKEGRKLDIEFQKTSYFKQYAKGYVTSLLVLIILGTTYSLSLPDTIERTSFFIVSSVGAMIMIGFASLLTLLFWFKRFDLIKMYYEEKNEK